MSLQNAILGILTFSPMNGYHLRKIFDKSINYAWSASLSQIYRDLGNLEKKGYVSSSIQQQEDRPDKKIYSITKDGETAFNEWLTNFPDTFSSPKRDEFMLRMFFGSKIGKNELIKQFKRFVEERKNFEKVMSKGKEVITEMRKTIEDNKIQSQIKENKLYWHFIAQRARMTNQALIDWAEYCIEELENSTLKEGE